MRRLIILAVLLLAACGGAPKHTAADVITAFKSAGLEAEGRPLTRDDYGMAPLICLDGSQRLLIASLGEDAGGRVFQCTSADEAARLKAYYDELGKGSAILFSYTYQNGPLMVQLNGDVPEAKAKAYEAALMGLK